MSLLLTSLLLAQLHLLLPIFFDRKTGIHNWPSLYAYILNKDTYCALYFRWKNRYFQPNRLQIYVLANILDKKIGIYNRPGLYISYFSLLQLDRLQVHIAFYFLGGKTGTSKQICLRYILHHIFWVGKQLPVVDTYCFSYFVWVIRYL